MHVINESQLELIGFRITHVNCAFDINGIVCVNNYFHVRMQACIIMMHVEIQVANTYC